MPEPESNRNPLKKATGEYRDELKKIQQKMEAWKRQSGQCKIPALNPGASETSGSKN